MLIRTLQGPEDVARDYADQRCRRQWDMYAMFEGGAEVCVRVLDDGALYRMEVTVHNDPVFSARRIA